MCDICDGKGQRPEFAVWFWVSAFCVFVGATSFFCAVLAEWSFARALTGAAVGFCISAVLVCAVNVFHAALPN